MERQIKETSIMGKRGQQRVITYGYNTQVDGLDIIRAVDSNTKEFTPIHRKSGRSLSVYFPTATKGVKFANKYLKDFDFTQDKDALLKDGKLGDCVRNAKIEEGV